MVYCADDLTKSCLSIAIFSVDKSFWKLCTESYQAIHLLRSTQWINLILWHLSLRWILVTVSILLQALLSPLSFTQWGWAMHIYVGDLTIIGSDNGLSPGLGQVIIWTNVGILLIGPLGTNFSGILIEILTFWFNKMCLNVSSAKWRPFCLGLNVLNQKVCAHENFCFSVCCYSVYCFKIFSYASHISLDKSILFL